MSDSSPATLDGWSWVSCGLRSVSSPTSSSRPGPAGTLDAKHLESLLSTESSAHAFGSVVRGAMGHATDAGRRDARRSVARSVRCPDEAGVAREPLKSD